MQARAGVVPVERGEAAECRDQCGVVREVELGQRHLARLAIEQAQRERAQLLGGEVQVQERLRGADDPVDVVAGRHQAQLARAAALGGCVLAVGAVAAAQVQRQRVVARLVLRGVEAVRPLRHAEPVAQRRAPVQARARVREHVEDVGG